MGADRTTADVLDGVDLTGRTALVTGVSAGLGVETARALASAGARVVGAARDLDKARAALAAAGVDDVELVLLDLADLASVRRAAEEVLGRCAALDLLVNNAGVMAPPLLRTAQGFELQLGTNHLGHFLLTDLLTPALRAAAPARVVNVSSRGHLASGIRWADPHYRESPYEKWQAYGQSKTANVLFTVELERRLAGDGVHAFALHPGVIMTELSRHLTEEDFARLGKRTERPREDGEQPTGERDAEQPKKPRGGGLRLVDVPTGAATSVWAATAPELEGRGGLYLEDCAVAGPAAEDGSGGVAAHATDPEQAERLWAWSTQEVEQA